MAHQNRTTNAGLAAGPFDAASAKRENDKDALANALITGMLVVYPVLATVVAVMVGLAFAGPMA
jgi:hypothetical protein